MKKQISVTVSILEISDREAKICPGEIMKQDKLKHELKRIYRYAYQRQIDWEWYRKFKSLTRYIDYKCDFKDDGACVRHERTKSKKYAGFKMNCCAGCNYTIGFNFRIPDDTQINRMARYFNKKTGFWRPGKGCILPRKYRSSVCLKEHCNPLEPIEWALTEIIRFPAGALYKYGVQTEVKLKPVRVCSFVITEMDAKVLQEVYDEIKVELIKLHNRRKAENKR